MENKSIHFKYLFPDNYNPNYINGVYGGVSPRGEIVANFYMERMPIPREDHVQITEDGKLGASISFEPEDHPFNMIRYIPSGICFDLETAIAFREWLDNKIEIASSIETSSRVSDSAKEGDSE